VGPPLDGPQASAANKINLARDSILWEVAGVPRYIRRLLAVIAMIVVVVVLVRSQLVPASFGQYGHYRGNALGEIASREPRHAGQKACAKCHEERFELKNSEAHAGLSCHTCHGVAEEHVKSEGKVDAERPKGNSFCLRCHQRMIGRPRVLAQIDGTEHAGKDTCWKCHDPHNPGLK